MRWIVVVVVGFVCMYEEYRRRYVSNGEKPKRLFVGDLLQILTPIAYVGINSRGVWVRIR